jgi:hypothetical protein
MKDEEKAKVSQAGRLCGTFLFSMQVVFDLWKVCAS